MDEEVFFSIVCPPYPAALTFQKSDPLLCQADGAEVLPAPLPGLVGSGSATGEGRFREGLPGR